MALAEYNLATLRFVYTSKLKKELQFTIQNLRRTLEWSNESWPVPQRLPRRAWRVSYLKRPFKCKSTVRHYVFHDWRYQFTFRDVQDVQSTVSTVLGSMTPETSCVCNFNWHFPGAPAYAQLNAVGEVPTGGIREATEYRRHPRLWVFPPTVNSGKAHLCLRLSSAWPFAEVRVVDVFGENYSLDFCRLNPNMTVPVLEIEDKVITDSASIAEFLGRHYAGDGDSRAIYGGKGQLMSRFVALVASWDEALYMCSASCTGCGCQRRQDHSVNRLRLVRLRQQYLVARSLGESDDEESGDENCCGVLSYDRKEREGEGDDAKAAPAGEEGEKGGDRRPEDNGFGTSSPSRASSSRAPALARVLPNDSASLCDAYLRKIAGIERLDTALGPDGETGERRAQAVEANRRILDRIWMTAEELLRPRTEESFLLGPELTTADAFFVPVLHGMREACRGDLKRYLKRHPSVKRYWAYVQEQEEAQVVVDMTLTCGLSSPSLMAKLLPCQLLGVRCGCIREPDLPEEVEECLRRLQDEAGLREGVG
ncbi:unnamed protein product [Polarella glacialis]|uniref:GST N-terminal domain-containing protein n=1 Tax=Polarella glacialis TaxID=89957 RepID=A0A813LCX8_POLGL|nr:unnamed protein product [Polarella glacialis]